MMSGFESQQSAMVAESTALEHADFSERDRATGEDHFAHASGRICITCGSPIGPTQQARRRKADDWAHEVCPVAAD